jgi:excisionase family DNA binding protein
MARKREEEKILDVSATMQGSLVFSDPVNLRINGEFQGTLTTKGNLIIGDTAKVNADIIGENIVIGGRVKGKIKTIKMISLTKTAHVTGDIEAPKVAIEEGAVFNGKCLMPQGKITLQELSDYLSIEEVKIMEWVNSGRIPVESAGDRLLFDRREVESWIGQNV